MSEALTKAPKRIKHDRELYKEGSLKKFVKRFKRDKELFFLSLPGVLFLFIFAYIPMVGIIIAFKDFNPGLGFFRSKWIGLENFKFLFADMDTLMRIVRNTLGLNLTFIFSCLIVSIAIALMLNEVSRRSIKIYQTIMFFPYFLSWVVISYIMFALLDMDHGWLNSLIGQRILWYNEPNYWPPILILSYIWKNAGYYAVIYYAAIIGIDSEYYEAASLDGATRWQQIRHITLPAIKPLITMMVLLQIGRIMYTDFGMFFQLTRDSTMLYPTTDVIDTYVYRALRQLGDTGMAAAAGLFQSVVGFILVLTSNLVVKKINPENSLF